MTEKKDSKTDVNKSRQLIGSRTEVSSTTNAEMPADGPRPKKK